MADFHCMLPGNHAGVAQKPRCWRLKPWRQTLCRLRGAWQQSPCQQAYGRRRLVWLVRPPPAAAHPTLASKTSSMCPLGRSSCPGSCPQRRAFRKYKASGASLCDPLLSATRRLLISWSSYHVQTLPWWLAGSCSTFIEQSLYTHLQNVRHYAVHTDAQFLPTAGMSPAWHITPDLSSKRATLHRAREKQPAGPKPKGEERRAAAAEEYHRLLQEGAPPGTK